MDMLHPELPPLSVDSIIKRTISRMKMECYLSLKGISLRWYDIFINRKDIR